MKIHIDIRHNISPTIALECVRQVIAQGKISADGKQHYYRWEATILRLPSNNIIYPQPLDMCKYYKSYTEAVEAALKYSLENLI